MKMTYIVVKKININIHVNININIHISTKCC